MKSFKNWREKFNEEDVYGTGGRMPSSRTEIAQFMKREFLGAPVRSAKLLYFIFQAMIELGAERDAVMNRLRTAIKTHLNDPDTGLSDEEKKEGMDLLQGWWSKLNQAASRLGIDKSSAGMEQPPTEMTSTEMT